MTPPSATASHRLPWWMWLVPLVWAGAFLTGSAALTELTPIEVSFLRFAICVVGGAVVLGRPALVVLRARPSGKAWGAMALLALSGGVAYHLFFYAGLARTAPPVASIIVGTNPILTALGVGLFLKARKPTASMMVGLAVAFAGALLLTADKPMAGGGSLTQRLVSGWGWGETLSLCAAAAWALSIVLLQHFRGTVLAGLPSAGVTYLVYGLTAALLFPLVLAEGELPRLGSLSTAGWGCLLYIGLAATVIAYTLYNAGVDRAGSARASQVAYAAPALTTLLSLWLVPELQPSWRTWLGLALVTVGLVVSEGRLVSAARSWAEARAAS